MNGEALLAILYLFIDGIGFGKNEALNPFARHGNSIFSLLGDRLPPSGWESWFIKPVNAHMGVSGLPQSATGQTALWTGINAPRLMGHHKTGFPGPTLIPVIQEHSIVRRFKQAGKKARLVNAYGQRYLDRIAARPRLMSTSTHVQLASGQPLGSMEMLQKGQALFMDITHEIMHSVYPQSKEEFPVKDPFERGQHLAWLAKRDDLLLFEYFLTDKLGHDQDVQHAPRILHHLEEFLRGIANSLGENDTVIVTSDHGNFEDMSTGSHTHNPVPLLAAGRGAAGAARLRYLYEIPEWIYELSGIG